VPEWLHDSFVRDEGASPTQVAVRLALALALGCVVAGVYRATQRRSKSQTGNLIATLVLLTVLIGMVTLVIGNSVARAFSLVGALAIVRFRTVVEDTRDTAFVIFAVAIGMAVGAGFLMVPVVAIPFAAAAAFLFRPRDEWASGEHTLAVRVGTGQSPHLLLEKPFERHLARSRLLSTATARQGAAIDVTYTVRLRHDDGGCALVAELNGLEGVQSVELRQA
jgi:uncharacterized membrane protein YhiD involved in acid resistance